MSRETATTTKSREQQQAWGARVMIADESEQQQAWGAWGKWAAVEERRKAHDFALYIRTYPSVSASVCGKDVPSERLESRV